MLEDESAHGTGQPHPAASHLFRGIEVNMATVPHPPQDESLRDRPTAAFGFDDEGSTEDGLEGRADAVFEAEARATVEAPPRRASGTYRLQLHAGFRFDDAGAIVSYLHELGVSDVYLSPYLAARPGSTHGYDVIDHTRINAEVGDEEAHDRFLAALKANGMGRILDIVPNHMGSGPANPFILDVLENGPQAKWAALFDIDWSPMKGSLEGRLLLPILEDLYGKVLEDGRLVLERDGGRVWVG